MTDVVKVFTPIKRVPTMIGKAQNGQKLPFGPYTLLQVGGGTAALLVTGILAMNLPINPAVTFVAGLIISAVTIFGLGLIPYTGVRISSRALWVAKLIVVRKPVSASGMPISNSPSQDAVFVEETVVIVLPDSDVTVTDRVEPVRELPWELRALPERKS